jgi:hypothetical protein
MTQATLNLEPPPPTTRAIRVTLVATETACAAAPPPEAPRTGSLPDDASGTPAERATADAASKVATPVGPGQCDACGADADELFDLPAQAGSGIAGLVVCRICGGVDASYGVGASGANLRTRKLESSAAPPCADAVTDSAPTKAPAGPRSKAARIIQLARSLGVQSDAEAAGQLGDGDPF